ncbi:MAG TPA: LysM domain-containing protein, partial [Geminicoccaceae bacterium]|nr:LysM domain-containing protein [Geminicoccaceae bacterium]
MAWSVVAALVAGCTADRPRDGSARVPWARSAVGIAGATSGPPPAGPPLPFLKPPPDRRSTALATAGKHLVVPGDTLLDLALSYNVPVRELAGRNGI